MTLILNVHSQKKLDEFINDLAEVFLGYITGGYHFSILINPFWQLVYLRTLPEVERLSEI